MNASFKERISAFTDDELSGFETRRVVDELLVDAELKGKVARYQLIGEAMRDELPASLNLNLADKIMAQIEDEPELSESKKVPESKPASSPQPWLKPLSGFAIAASVAAVSILALKMFTQTDVSGTGAEMAASTPAPAVATVAPSPVTDDTSAIKPVRADAEMIEGGFMRTQQPAAGESTMHDPRLEGYMATHAEFATQPGIMSRARVVGLESSED